MHMSVSCPVTGATWSTNLAGLCRIVTKCVCEGRQAATSRRGSDEASYDRRFSAFSLSASIGQLVGPAIAGIVAGQGSLAETSRALVVGGVLALITVPLALLAHRFVSDSESFQKCSRCFRFSF